MWEYPEEVAETAESGMTRAEYLIEEIQRKVFDYDTGSLPVQLSDLMSFILEQQLFDLGDTRKLQVLNRIMTVSLEAIQNHDFLLLADLVEFELTKLLGINRTEKIIQ